MIFKVYHIMNKPIDPGHRDAYAAEWKVRANEFLADKPKSTDLEAWQNINTQLDDLQAELQAKYPCTTIWSIDSVGEIQNLINNYGTLSFCMEDGLPVIYVMDLSSTETVKVDAE